MIGKWKRMVVNELQPLYKRRELREKPDVWILRGEYSILAKLREMLEETRKELMVAAPLFAKGFMDAGVPLLRHLSGSGVNVQVMVTKDWDAEKVSGIEKVKVREHMFGGGVIADGREALLFLGEDEATLVIWSNHMGLVKFARDYFQYLWETAKDISQP
jgi:sugar-specific transcriptional regulator TrmB